MSKIQEQSKYIYTPNFIITQTREIKNPFAKINNLNFKLFFLAGVDGFLNQASNSLFSLFTIRRGIHIRFFGLFRFLNRSTLSIVNLFNADYRTLWLLNFKMNRILWTRKFVRFWKEFFVIANSSYLAILIIAIVFGLKFISTNSVSSKNSESFLNRFLNKYSFVDKRGTQNLVNFATITTSAKKLDDPTRLIKHKTVVGDTINKIADKYGLNSDTVAINNRLLNFDKEKELEKDKDLYLPWQDSYIFLAKEDTEPKKLAEIFKIDESRIYAGNEDILNTETSKFPKDSLVLIPTKNFDEVKKYEELEKVKLGTIITGNKTNDEKTQKLAENYASETNGTGKYSGTSTNQKSAGFIWPAAGNLSRCLESGHIACDIANASMPPVFAVQDGVIKDVYRFTVYGYGNAVLISHSNGLETLYAHLNEVYVSKGQNILQGQSIGQMGTTGNSTGVHCHFEVRVNGIKQNPLNYLP